MVAWLVLTAPSWALTVNVGGPGGYASLSDAVAQANNLGITEIDLAGATWGPSHGTVDVSNLVNPLRIDGFGAAAQLPPLLVDSSGVTVANCYAAEYVTTGIAAYNADLTLESTSVIGDVYGVQSTGGSLTVSGGVFTLNTSNAIIASGSDLSIDGGAVFLSNTADTGGAAVFASGGGSLAIGAASFQDNQSFSFGNGGAVYAQDSSTVALGPGTEFAGNRAPNGGAVDVENLSGPVTVVTLDTVTFTGNSADPDVGIGGAVRVSGVASLAVDFSTFDGTDLTAAAWGGGMYVQNVPVVTGSGNTFLDIGAAQGGGAVEASLCPSFSLTDSIATNAFTGEYGTGGFLFAQGADVTLIGGVYTGDSAGAGGVVGAVKYSQIGPALAITGATVVDPSAGEGAFLSASSGSTVDVSFSTVTGAAADGGAAFWVDSAASVSITDNDIAGSTTDGDGGAVTVTDSNGVFIERNSICDSHDTRGGASALTASGGSITNNRIFGNDGTAAELEDGSGAADFSHNTLVDNGPVDLELESGSAAEVDWNLFAPGLLATAIQVDSPVVASLGDHDFVEDGALPGDAPFGFIGGVAVFQHARPFACDDLLWVSWDDAALVDFAPGTPDAQDIDGSAPDYGAWGGPESYAPAVVFDADADGVRDDVDCAIDDPSMFPGGPANTDCDCDTDGDGWVQQGCADPDALYDCDDGDVTVHPTAYDGPVDGVDSDCDGAPEDGSGTTGTTGTTGATGPGGGEEEVPCEGTECADVMIFGGGGSCSTSGAPASAGLVGAALLALRRRRTT